MWGVLASCERSNWACETEDVHTVCACAVGLGGTGTCIFVLYLNVLVKMTDGHRKPAISFSPSNEHCLLISQHSKIVCLVDVHRGMLQNIMFAALQWYNKLQMIVRMNVYIHVLVNCVVRRFGCLRNTTMYIIYIYIYIYIIYIYIYNIIIIQMRQFYGAGGPRCQCMFVY